MYFCQVTKKFSRQGKPDTEASPAVAGEKLNKIVIETRDVQYKHWDNEAEEEWFSYGTEIVREINACDNGVQVWNAMSPEQRVALVKSL